MSKSKDMPDIIWAWFFCESKQDDLIKGGWTNEPDKRETPYVPKSTLDALTAENDRLQARVAELEDALKPFSNAAGVFFAQNGEKGDLIYDGGELRSDCIFGEDLFVARQALKETPDD